MLLYDLRLGIRLEQPKQCPPELYTIMSECWKSDASSRPSFSTLVSKITALQMIGWDGMRDTVEPVNAPTPALSNAAIGQAYTGTPLVSSNPAPSGYVMQLTSTDANPSWCDSSNEVDL